MTRCVSLCLAALVIGSSFPREHVAAQDASPPVVEASLESLTDGNSKDLRAERGRRVVVMFYEDRPHVEENEAFKLELSRFMADNRLADRAVVYGVANLGDVGSYPRALVRAMIRPLLSRYGVDILLDWDGLLRRTPVAFPTDATTLALIDRQGRVVWRHTGRIEGEQRTQFYRAFRAALSGR